jgi:hypothetical protein
LSPCCLSDPDIIQPWKLYIHYPDLETYYIKGFDILHGGLDQPFIQAWTLTFEALNRCEQICLDRLVIVELRQRSEFEIDRVTRLYQKVWTL